MTMHLSGTVMEIWPFEVLPGRLFQEQSLVGWSVLNITLISYTPLHYVRNVAREELKFVLDQSGDRSAPYSLIVSLLSDKFLVHILLLLRSLVYLPAVGGLHHSMYRLYGYLSL